MTDQSDGYGKIQTTEDLGRLVRGHRKRKDLTLESASGLANLSVRFLSEFERGKNTAEIGKVLKALNTLGLEVIVQPRKGLGAGASAGASAGATAVAGVSASAGVGVNASTDVTAPVSQSSQLSPGSDTPEQ